VHVFCGSRSGTSPGTPKSPSRSTCPWAGSPSVRHSPHGGIRVEAVRVQRIRSSPGRQDGHSHNVGPLSGRVNTSPARCWARAHPQGRGPPPRAEGRRQRRRRDHRLRVRGGRTRVRRLDAHDGLGPAGDRSGRHTGARLGRHLRRAETRGRTCDRWRGSGYGDLLSRQGREPLARNYTKSRIEAGEGDDVVASGLYGPATILHTNVLDEWWLWRKRHDGSERAHELPPASPSTCPSSPARMSASGRRRGRRSRVDGFVYVSRIVSATGLSVTRVIESC
jgi:hypothetical protein